MSTSGPGWCIGMGASAGGLEALGDLLAHVSETGRCTWIIAQHMAPDGHAELMVTILGRTSRLPVELATDGHLLRPDRVYLLPSGSDGVVAGECLRLQAATRLSRPSVDVLFESLAAQCGSRAVGIVLSGTGSDGVRGCRAIRARGGLTLVQEPRTARHSGMPQACLEAGVVDETLAPQAMGARLEALLTPAPAPPPDQELASLPLLLTRVRAATGIDFHRYKSETLARRLARREQELGLDSPAAYLAWLDAHPEEVTLLAQRFLVPLSSFRRDPEAFAALEAELRAEPARRIWVPGCATGEEVYTLVMLCPQAELLVGTDLHEPALGVARAGRYRAGTIPAELREHMLPDPEGCRVPDAWRRLCRFEARDLLADEPPARDLDLVSCRNLLIYLTSEAQAQVLQGFHRALRPGGLLFLSPSESLGMSGETLFRAVSREHKLFRARG